MIRALVFVLQKNKTDLELQSLEGIGTYLYQNPLINWITILGR